MAVAYCPKKGCPVISMQGVGSHVHGKRTRCINCGTPTSSKKGKR